jgi:hypothetical protein
LASDQFPRVVNVDLANGFTDIVFQVVMPSFKLVATTRQPVRSMANEIPQQAGKSIKIVDTVICSSELKVGHPELFHYTGRAAFKAIVSSNTLWSTHFRHLNDDAEVSTLKPQLLETMAAVLNREVKNHNTGIRNRYFRHGGAKPMARDFVASLYAATFERADTDFAVDAYTTSFSTHAADTPYEQENGLESQWRYYAQDGFCLVFDTNGIGDLLGGEFDRHDFTHLNLENVRYIQDGSRLPDYFDFIEPALKAVAEQIFKGSRSRKWGPLSSALRDPAQTGRIPRGARGQDRGDPRRAWVLGPRRKRIPGSFREKAYSSNP